MIENVMWLLNMNAILPSNQQHRNREITIKTELCCHTDRLKQVILLSCI